MMLAELLVWTKICYVGICPILLLTINGSSPLLDLMIRSLFPNSTFFVWRFTLGSFCEFSSLIVRIIKIFGLLLPASSWSSTIGVLILFFLFWGLHSCLWSATGICGTHSTESGPEGIFFLSSLLSLDWVFFRWRCKFLNCDPSCISPLPMV